MGMPGFPKVEGYPPSTSSLAEASSSGIKIPGTDKCGKNDCAFRPKAIKATLPDGESGSEQQT
ncbi:MAG: hypothetical protein OHK0046_25860 [Anaerolineae bacterium]